MQIAGVDKEANMDKPLSEWTLGEVKAECEKHTAHCVGCPLWTDAAGCRLDTSCYRDNDPKKWDLSEPPCWTEQEAELAKALYEVRRSVSLVIGRSTGGTLWWRDGDRGEGILPHKLFPSLNEGDCVRLIEIIGGGE